MTLEQLSRFLNISVLVVFIILVSILTITAIILPDDNISHKLNPFSQLKFWLMEDTFHIQVFINIAVLVLVFITVITTLYLRFKSSQRGN
jgi:archaellum biogenesis protein FlaJ (TadC family)